MIMNSGGALSRMNSDTGDDDSDYGSVPDDEILQAEGLPSGTKRGRSDSTTASVIGAKKVKVVEDNGPIAAAEIARGILKKTWGFPGFRLKQEQAIARLITGGSAAVVFPTGGGKSLVYQIPALAFDEYDQYCGHDRGGGVTLVVSPLIALMKDQVDALKKRGVKAAAMDSSQSREAWLETSDMLKNGQLKLLYVAPERLNNEGFVAMIRATKIRMVAVDEAHCISEWGHAFRPDYLKIARFVKEIDAERVLCLTATATLRVAEDICNAFDIDADGLFRTTTYRSNLRLLAQSFTKGDDKLPVLKAFLVEYKGPSIVYVHTHKDTDTVCASLRAAKLNAHSYHAGMATEARTSVQERFMASNDIVIVATIAFGMGIDKANIRNVIHYQLPKSLEGYAQEIGRAGRDGLESNCVIFLCGEDISLIENWSRADVPSDRSVHGFVNGLLDEYERLKPGDIIDRNPNDDSREWDIRPNSLGLLNAQLELRFDLMRAITPKYSKYQFIKTSSFASITADGSKVSNAIHKASNTKAKWTHIDVDGATGKSGVAREDIVRKLQQWHDSNAIIMSPSGVINRFRVLKPFPQNDLAKRRICELAYGQIVEKEREDMDRVQGVIALVTTEGCLSKALAQHFGDGIPVPGGKCGHCQYCLTGIAVPYEHSASLKGRVDGKRINEILNVTKIRDDAQFLTRIAFGITSPRATSEKLSKHDVFGTMSDCDFDEVLLEFKKVCPTGRALGT